MANGYPGEAALRETLILETAAKLQLEATKRGAVGFTLSRATWLRHTPVFEGAAILPVVGGQTIWETAASPDRIVVVEQPNYFGRREMTGPSSSMVVQTGWWPGPGGPHPADPAADGPRGDVEAARHLATGLRSIRRVRLLHGAPEAPWFVISVPVSPQKVAAALQTAGFGGCLALGAAFPEFPGGLHLQVAWPRRDNGEVIAVVRGVVEDLERQ